MTSVHIRPRFKSTYNLTPAEIQSRVMAHIKEPNCMCTAKVIPGFIVLRIKESEKHFWSPQLSLSFEFDEDENKTVIRGLYGPNPTVWAMFTFGYAAIGISALFLGFYGFSKYTLGMNAHALYALPVLALMAALLYLIAQFGQKLGVEQTFTLHHFFEETIGTRIHIV